MSKTSTIILLLPAFTDVHMNVGNICPTFQMSSFFGKMVLVWYTNLKQYGCSHAFLCQQALTCAGLWQVLELGYVNAGKTTIIQPSHCPSCNLVPEQPAQPACPTKWSAPHCSSQNEWY